MKSLRSVSVFVAAFTVASCRLFAALAAAVVVVLCNVLALCGVRTVFACGANTLSNLIPDVYAALDVVSRELVGFIPSVTTDFGVDRLAVGQTLRGAQTPANTSGRTITPAMAFPVVADQVIANKSLTITKQRAFPFNWTGEEQKAIDAGPGFLTTRQQQVAQAIRAAVNEIEVDLAVAAYQGASRAYGTAGTTPFATNLAESAQMKKILDDNGGVPTDRSLVINTTAGAALRTLLNNPLNANTSLNTDLTRQGVILDVNGFKFREAAAVQTPAIGTSNGAYTTTAAGFAVGTTSIPLITGAGTILAGDVITFAGDTNKYVVATGIAAPGTIVLQAPGLLVAMSAATKAVTSIASSPRNVGLSRNALVLGVRLPAVPEGGDLAILRETVTDDRSGLSFELAVYPGYRMLVYEIGIVWGTLAMKPEHMAILLG